MPIRESNDPLGPNATAKRTAPSARLSAIQKMASGFPLPSIYSPLAYSRRMVTNNEKSRDPARFRSPTRRGL